MTDLIILAIVAGIAAAAGLYIRREKKNGRRCVGCPHSGSCSGGCGCH